jgi:CRISPR-associated protein Csm3
MKLLDTKIITGNIYCVSGLHIGGSNDVIEIGGIDNPVIKHPITREPYIPGSSLKGKMRSQMERKLGKIGDRGGPCGCGEQSCYVCRVFGPHKNMRHNLGPTRIIVRDAMLCENTRNEYNEIMASGQSYIEIKTENSINRQSGAAANGSLRIQERVPAGACFEMELALQIYDMDDEDKMVEFIKTALKEVENSYLGGSGSRGSGKVKFKELKINGQPFEL